MKWFPPRKEMVRLVDLVAALIYALFLWKLPGTFNAIWFGYFFGSYMTQVRTAGLWKMLDETIAAAEDSQRIAKKALERCLPFTVHN